jgi:hypothetical protein
MTPGRGRLGTHTAHCDPLAYLLFLASELGGESFGSYGGIAKHPSRFRVGGAEEPRGIGAELSQARQLGCSHESFLESNGSLLLTVWKPRLAKARTPGMLL